MKMEDDASALAGVRASKPFGTMRTALMVGTGHVIVSHSYLRQSTPGDRPHVTSAPNFTVAKRAFEEQQYERTPTAPLRTSSTSQPLGLFRKPFLLPSASMTRTANGSMHFCATFNYAITACGCEASVFALHVSPALRSSLFLRLSSITHMWYQAANWTSQHVFYVCMSFCGAQKERCASRPLAETEASHVILHTPRRPLGALVCTHEGETEAADGVGDHLGGHTSLVAGVAGDGAAMSVLGDRRKDGRITRNPDAEFARSSGNVDGLFGGTYWSTTFSK